MDGHLSAYRGAAVRRKAVREARVVMRKKRHFYQRRRKEQFVSEVVLIFAPSVLSPVLIFCYVCAYPRM